MKTNQKVVVNARTIRLLQLGVVIFSLLFLNEISAQVNFTQTTDADFNKGVANNLLVSGGNLSLQYSASNTGLWWTGTTFLPQNLTGHRVVTANNQYVYLVGGFSGSNYSNKVYKASIQTSGISSWTMLNPLPDSVRDAAVVIGANTIYVIGGRNATQLFDAIYFATINSDGTIGEWKTSSVSLPSPAWGHTAVYVNGYIYLAGGSTSSSEISAVNTVYYIKLLADNEPEEFVATTNLPANRNMHGIATYNNKIFILGGYDETGVKTNNVYSVTPDIDGTIGSWSDETDLPLDLSNHSAVISNGLIMVLGGATTSNYSNAVYYANLDQTPPLTWVESPNTMFDLIKDGAAFAGNGQVIFTGGKSQAGTVLSNCRYAALTLSSNFINHGVFVSSPFYQLGAERLINHLAFTSTYNNTYSNCEVAYRLAGSNKIWGGWTTLTSSSPIAVNDTKQYAQYRVIFTSQTTNNVTFSDMTLNTPGTTISGNLNGISNFTAAASPYVVTGNISFTSGTHTFEAGTNVLFSPGTSMSVNQASIICNGTLADSVKFYNLGIEPGLWGGINFSYNSDIGVSSQFFYTVIANANGNNLYCGETTQPFLSHCTISGAIGDGISLFYSDPSFQNTTIHGNTENGLYLYESNPTVTVCEISNNGKAGIYANTTATILNGTTISNNLYGIQYNSPNLSITKLVGSPTLTNNTFNGIVLPGGDITDNNKIWHSLPYDYFILGTIKIGGRLTIKPGNTFKMANGTQIKVGNDTYGFRGELFAIGTSDSLIIFTPIDGIAGGWDGISFNYYSGINGGQSRLNYCVVEKGTNYNIACTSTTQPTIQNCKIQNSASNGIILSNSSIQIQNTQFLNNNGYPLKYNNAGCNSYLVGNTYTGNTNNYISLNGGDYVNDVTFYNDGIPYHVLNNMRIGKNSSHSRITIKPGVTLAFDPGKELQVGYSSYYGGELFAEGTADSIITFKPYNDSIGGWNGIYFSTYSDSYGSTSSMKYCKIEKGADFNLACSGTNQPSMQHLVLDKSADIGLRLSSSDINIESCIISNSASDGLVIYSSNGLIHNCQFLNNGGYPMKFDDTYTNTELVGNTYTGNTNNYIALSGGYYVEDVTFYNDGIPYHVLNNIQIGKYYDHSRMTIKPGVTLEFDKGKQLQVGFSNYYGGELFAEGTADSIITFKPYNDSIGGWNGIYFNTYSDSYGSASSMKFCKIENGSTYNMYCENTNQPLLDHCILSQSSGNGLRLYNSPLIVRNSSFTNNATNGILLEGSTNLIIGNDSTNTCNLYYNGTYDLYNNTINNINARYNYWAMSDSADIAARIYDKNENSSRGHVYYTPIRSLPSVLSDSMVLSGSLKYANPSLSPLSNAYLAVKNFAGDTVLTTTTDGNGEYIFDPLPSGFYQMVISPDDTWGGVNGTDALNILQHFTQISPLTGMNLAAGDVNKSYYVNGTDALLVKLRFVGLISSFPSGDYLFVNDTISINGSQVTNNVNMLCYGDVNASLSPMMKNSSPVYLTESGLVNISSFSEFDYPVKLKFGKEVAAISLGFYYPEEYFDITGVELGNGSSDFSYTAENGLFRFAWCDPDGMYLKDQQTIITLKMKSHELSDLPIYNSFSIYEYSELADKSGMVLDGEVLEIPEIKVLATGLPEVMEKFAISVYPNPFWDRCTVGFTLDQESEVNLTLFNYVGEQMNLVDEGVFMKGNHQVEISSLNLKSGIYVLKIVIKTNDQISAGFIKVVVNN